LNRVDALRAIALAAVAVAIGENAHATGFMVARFGGEHGTPTTSDPTATYYNPAGIAFAQGTNVYVEGIFGYRSLTVDRDPGAIDHPNQMPGTPDPTVNSGKGKLLNFIASPFIGATTDFGVRNLGVGVSFSAPFGGIANFDKNDAFAGNTQYPGAVDGPQRWSETEGTIQSTYLTAAGAYRLPGNISVGVSLNLVMSKANDTRAFNFDGTDDVVNATGGVQEGRALIDVSGTTLSIGAGVVWRPMKELAIGVSYQSEPGFGTMTLSGRDERKLGTTAPASDNIELLQTLPDIFRLGIEYRPIEKVELRLWGSFERWSVFDNQCILNADNPNRNCALDAQGVPTAAANGSVLNNIPRHWQDAVDIRASGSYWLNPSLELQFGLGFDGNAVPDATLEAGLPDQDEVSASAGASVALMGNKLHLTATYTQFVAFTRTTAPRPRNASGEAIAPYQGISRAPDMAGSYDSSVGILTVGAQYSF
jgi:long-chain fatty acid transport protein